MKLIFFDTKREITIKQNWFSSEIVKTDRKYNHLYYKRWVCHYPKRKYFSFRTGCLKDKQSSTILAAQLVPFIRMERKEFLEKALVQVQTTKFVDVISQPTKKAIISLVFKVIFELLSSRLEARWGKKKQDWGMWSVFVWFSVCQQD